jgi:hypothetical protein
MARIPDKQRRIAKGKIFLRGVLAPAQGLVLINVVFKKILNRGLV